MRKHRLYGFVLAMLLGTAGITQLPTSKHLYSPVAVVRDTATSHVPAHVLLVVAVHHRHAVDGYRALRLTSSYRRDKASHLHTAHDARRSGTGRRLERRFELASFNTPLSPATFAKVAADVAPSPPPAERNVQPATHPGSETNIASERPAPPTRATSDDVWARLRQCESGGDYAEDSGNGYYGAYQFSLSTWHALGYAGLPSDASAQTQDEAASQLQADRGWDQWPSCASQLGLI